MVMTQHKIEVNKNLFFIFLESNIAVWDYVNHTQFLVDKEHFSALVDYVTVNKSIDDQVILSNLLDGHILVEQSSNAM